MKAVIFGGAPISNYGFCRKYLTEDAVIICSDGGTTHVMNLGILPDYIIGDLDSSKRETLAYYENLNVPVKKFPKQKNETDMELSLRFAMELGCDEAAIIGALGGRLDHTLGNCHLLLFALKNNVKAFLVDEKNYICLIDDGIKIEGKKGDLVSILPLSMEVKGITNKGLLYPLNDFDLKIGSHRGISNVMVGSEAEISVREGCLYIIKSED